MRFSNTAWWYHDHTKTRGSELLNIYSSNSTIKHYLNMNSIWRNSFSTVRCMKMFKKCGTSAELINILRVWSHLHLKPWVWHLNVSVEKTSAHFLAARLSVRLQYNNTASALIKKNRKYLLEMRENLWILRTKPPANGNIKLPHYTYRTEYALGWLLFWDAHFLNLSIISPIKFLNVQSLILTFTNYH